MAVNQKLDTFWRSTLTECMGGTEFDKPGGGYSFSTVLDEERALAKANIPGDPSSALLRFSIADPTWKMPQAAWDAGEAYYRLQPHSTRYTDNFGVALCEEAGISKNTHEQLADYLNGAHHGSGVVFTDKWVQYLPGSIKRALSEFIPTALFDAGTILVFPAPGYGVIKDPKNKRDAKSVDVPLIYDQASKSWDIDSETAKKLLNNLYTSFNRRVMYLNIPHNPTGMAYCYEQWVGAIEWALKNDVILIVDEAYTHLRFGATCSVLDVPGWEDCCIVLPSISIGWNATGERFGWVVAHPTMISALRMVTDVKDSGMFGPTIASALWCIKNPEFANKTMAEYAQLHRALAEGLQSVGFEAKMPDAGLCQFMKAPEAINGQKMENSAQCAKWLRDNLRISTMHAVVKYKAGGVEIDTSWLRWATTITLVPECGLPTEASVIAEGMRRLRSVKFEF